jgi:mannose-6-phosphate isomerase
MLYPLTFHPHFKERVWGGRNLERLYRKALPPGKVIGESWEITDRPEGVSVIANGPLAGQTLRFLMEHHRRDILGLAADAHPGGPFPLLIKLLDANDTLSVQVHPPAAKAAELGGEPKTEMWYIADATPDAVLYAGLKAGVSRDEFERRIRAGTVAECLHRIPVRTGDAMFLPSGRLHAIGAGNVLFEIQQNSDTTYRVFDWNRPGLDGQPRELHVEKSLASINFEDFEPSVIKSIYSRNPTMKVRYVVDDPLFRVDGYQVKRGLRWYLRSESVQILGLLRGQLDLQFNDMSVTLQPGGFCLVPACLGRVTVTAPVPSEYLHVQT